MFNKLYKLYKSPINNASTKKISNIFLLKDMHQYKLTYKNIINYRLGSFWVLGDKKISFKNLKIKKLFTFLIWIFFYVNLILMILY